MPLTEKDGLTEKLAQHRRNLYLLQEKKAKYGIDVPISVLNEIEDEKREIARLEAELKSLEGQPDRLVPALREYVDKVYHECRYLETEGEPEMPLTEVYVMLQAQPTPRRQQKTDLPPGQPSPQEKEVEATLAREEPPSSLPEVLRQHQHLLILGESGAGKTTLLQYVALCFANDLRPTENHDHKPNLDDLGLLDELRLPLRIELRDYQGESWLGDFVVDHLRKKYNVPETQTESWLKGERLAILLDGLDEVPVQNRAEVIRLVQNFARDSQGRGQRIVVTSRIAAYREGPGLDEEDFKPYTLRPLDDEDTARHYIAGWLRALNPQREDQADELWEKLKEQRSLKDALTNPLLLRLAVSVYVRTGEVARSRAALYRRYVEDVLIPRAREYRGLNLPPRRIQEALEAVAWAMQVKGVHREGGLIESLEQEVPGAEDGSALLMDLRAKVGLLIAYGREARELRHLLAFRHLTFQEYFVAWRLRKQWEENPEATWIWLRPHLYEDNWQETVLLLGSLLREKEATDFLGCIMQEPQESGWPLPGHLYLVVEALAQGACPTDAFQEQIYDTLLTLTRDEQRHERVRIRAAEKLGCLGQTGVAANILLALARDEHAEVHVRVANALGRLGQIEVAADILLALAHDGQVNARMRERAVVALGRLKQTKALLALARDERVEDWMRVGAAVALGHQGQTEVAANILLALARDGRVNIQMRKRAVVALDRLEQTKALLALARDEEVAAEVHVGVANALGRLGQIEVAADILLALAHDGQVNARMRVRVAKALGRLGQTNKEAESWLALACDEQVAAGVRVGAAKALGSLGQIEVAVEILLTLACDEQVAAGVRVGAAEALGRLAQATEATLSTLREVAEHGLDKDVRRTARDALQQLQEKQSHPQSEDEDTT